MRAQRSRDVVSSLVVLVVVSSYLAFAADAAAQPIGHVPFSSPAAQIAVNPNTDRVYIGGGFAQNQLTVIDASNPAAPTVVTTISGSQGGSGVVVNPTANTFYTSNGFGGQVLRYDGATNTQNGSVSIGACPGLFDFNPATNLVYVTRQCAGGGAPAGVDPLYVLDAGTLGIVGNNMGTGGVVGIVRVNSTTGKAYVGTQAGNTAVFGPSPAFAYSTIAASNIEVLNSHNNRGYFRTGTGDVQVRDGATDALITTLTGLGTIGVNTVTDHLYAVVPGTPTINVLDGASHAVLGTLTLGAGKQVLGMGVDSTKNRLYVAGCDQANCGPTQELFVLQGLQANVSCDIQMSQATYASGDTVSASTFRFANPGTSAVAVEVKVSLGTPTAGAVSIINAGATGTVSFPAGLNINLGPLNLFTVSGAIPPGSYALNCRLLDPVTGALLAEDLNGFVIQ